MEKVNLNSIPKILCYKQNSFYYTYNGIDHCTGYRKKYKRVKACDYPKLNAIFTKYREMVKDIPSDDYHALLDPHRWLERAILSYNKTDIWNW